MRKFIIRDEDTKYKVEEYEHEDVVDETEEAVSDLTKEEIDVLKKLIPIADKIITMVAEQTETTDEELEEEAEKDYVDEEDIVEDEDKEETVIESEKLERRPMAKDSKSSFGAIERKKVTKDSINDSEDINAAWAKRYGGNR